MFFVYIPYLSAELIHCLFINNKQLTTTKTEQTKQNKN